MDRIIFNDDAYVEESYALNPFGVFGEDVGEWTAEEFYGSICDRVYMEDARTDAMKKHPVLTSIVAKLYENCTPFRNWMEKRTAKGLAKEKAKEASRALMAMEAPTITTALAELEGMTAYKKFISDLRFRSMIVTTTAMCLKVIKLITHEIMFKQKWGRFPADLKSFYEYVFDMPKELTKTDIKKFKDELKKLRKDTKWLIGKAGNEFITPKERKIVELMNDQLDDLLTWRMIPQDVETQKVHRVMDRLKQFIETSYDFLESIHSDMIDTKTKNRMSDALK